VRSGELLPPYHHGSRGIRPPHGPVPAGMSGGIGTKTQPHKEGPDDQCPVHGHSPNPEELGYLPLSSGTGGICRKPLTIIMPNLNALSHDRRISSLLDAELARQRRGVELIASENFTSAAVLRAMGSCL